MRRGGSRFLATTAMELATRLHRQQRPRSSRVVFFGNPYWTRTDRGDRRGSDRDRRRQDQGDPRLPSADARQGGLKSCKRTTVSPQRIVKTTVATYGPIAIYSRRRVKDESGAKQMQKITYFWLIAIVCFWRAALSVAADPPSLRPLAPDYVRSLKSQNINTQTTVNFVNRTDDPVDVYWVNYEGHLVFYQHLASGECWVVQTHPTTPWPIYDDN